MGEYRCIVCENKLLAEVVDEKLYKGMPATEISTLMGMRGTPVSAIQLRDHKKHFRERAEEREVPKTRRNLAGMVQERVADAFEAGNLDVMDRHHLPSIKMGLDAETILDKREARKDNLQLGMLVLLLGGADGQRALAPLAISGGEVIEGEAIEIDD